MHNPALANRRRDPSDPIGVVSTDIFGTPGRGAVVEIWSGWSSGFIVVVTPRKKTTKWAASPADAVNARATTEKLSHAKSWLFSLI